MGAGMDLYLIRHPRVIGGDGRCYGRMDLPLAADPAVLAQHIRAELPEGCVDTARLISSPASRCRALANCLHPDAALDSRLLEMHFGSWEGLLWEQIDRDALDRWAANPLTFAPPGGETPLAVRERALAWVADLPADERAVIAIAHAGPIRMLLSYWMQIEPTGWPRIKIDFGGISHVQLEAGRVNVLAVDLAAQNN